MENSTPYVRCPSSLYRRYAEIGMPSRQGTFSSRPSNALIASSALVRWRRRKMGLRPRSRGQTRQMRDIFLRSVSFRLSSHIPLRHPLPFPLRSLTSSLFFQISQVSMASPRSNRHCCSVRRVVRFGDMTIALTVFVSLSTFCTARVDTPVFVTSGDPRSPPIRS